MNNDIEAAVRRLIDIANERGGDDNITIVLTEVVGLDNLPEFEDESSGAEDESTLGIE